MENLNPINSDFPHQIGAGWNVYPQLWAMPTLTVVLSCVFCLVFCISNRSIKYTNISCLFYINIEEVRDWQFNLSLERGTFTWMCDIELPEAYYIEVEFSSLQSPNTAVSTHIYIVSTDGDITYYITYYILSCYLLFSF